MLLCFLGILLASQQISVLEILGDIPSSSEDSHRDEIMANYRLMLIERVREPQEIMGEFQKGWRPRWAMVFIWQCPTMFMSYSFVLFILGLSMFVCTPLIHKDAWGPESDVRRYIAVISPLTYSEIGCRYISVNIWAVNGCIFLLLFCNAPFYRSGQK
jgi:hypothetical protein